MIRIRELEVSFEDIFRIYISGRASAGKTWWAKKLLETNLFKCERVFYYHPDFHETCPVKWKSLDKPVFYQAGLPSLDELLEIPEHSCLVFDDLFSQCCESKDIDYLFRVLSTKRKLSCMIMTQRYFAEGKNRLGLSIRNSCNYHVLMNNADARTNMNVASSMCLKPEITRATEENKSVLYPYIFIDTTNLARVNGLRVYTNIFDKYKIVIMGSTKFYLLAEADFKANFEITDSNSAERKKVTDRKRAHKRRYPSREEESDQEALSSSEEESDQEEALSSSEEESDNSRYYSSSSSDESSSESDDSDRRHY